MFNVMAETIRVATLGDAFDAIPSAGPSAGDAARAPIRADRSRRPAAPLGASLGSGKARRRPRLSFSFWGRGA